MKAWRGYCKLMDKVNYVCMLLGVFCVIFLAALVSTEIIGRTFFNWSTLIADEYGGYLLCAITFFCGPYCLQQGTFLRVEILYPRFRGLGKKLIDLINSALAITLCFFIFRFVWKTWYSSYIFGAVSTSFSHTPLIYPQGLMVLGMVLLFLELIRELVAIIITPAEKSVPANSPIHSDNGETVQEVNN